MVMVAACIIPVAAYPLILAYYHQTGRTKMSAVLAGIASSAFLYGYIADQGNDIYRHIQNLNYYVGIPLYKAFDAAFLKTVYVWDIWQWIIAHLHNDNLMQSSGAFVGYSLIAYIIFDYGKRSESSRKNINITFLIAFLTVSPLSLAIGIRSGNALVFCAFAIYLYFVQNRNYWVTAMLIALSILLHHSMIVVLALWLAYAVFKKKPVIGAILVAVIMLTFTNYEQYISMFMGGGSIFESLGEDLQLSVTTYYRGGRYLGVHHYVTLAVQAALVVLLFVRGGGTEVFTLRRIGADSEQVITTRLRINQFQIVFIAAVFSLLVLLTYNGNRLFLVSLTISFLPFLDTLEEYPFLSKRRFLLVDIMLTGLIMATFLLYCHDMNWGTGSLISLVRSGFFGYLSRWLF